MKNMKITIEYDGTAYCGWQVQKNGLSIQEVIQKAIESIVAHKISLTGASRTDAGVHARGMVANFFTSTLIPEHNLLCAINNKLPYDIVILNIEQVDKDFHSRYCSIGKMYSYIIINRKVPSALLRNYAAHISVILDLQKMQQAAIYFIGTHDFSAFKSTGSSIKDNVRTISSLLINKREDTIKIDIRADGFLYNMVRIIVGTLVDVGRGKITHEEIPQIISSCDRNKAGRTAPPQGLYLECVYYK